MSSLHILLEEISTFNNFCVHFSNMKNFLWSLFMWQIQILGTESMEYSPWL